VRRSSRGFVLPRGRPAPGRVPPRRVVLLLIGA
jgi:hypothetical protein